MLKGHLGFKGESSTIDIGEKVDGVQTITVSDYRGTQTTTIEDGELTGAMVVDNLTSDTTNRPLSAKQGKVLNTSINTANTNMGTLSSLDTTDKTSLVNAINEVKGYSNYSTSEQVAGKWIDNKPLYRRVFFQTNANNISNVALNSENIIKMECLVKRTGYNTWRTIPWLFVNNDSLGDVSWAGGFYFNNNTVNFQLGSNLNEIDKLVFIIEYTKTTD